MARPANGGRLTCESCVAIDVREGKRSGLLRPGQVFPASWSRAGVPCGSISVRTESDTVVLINPDWAASSYPLLLVVWPEAAASARSG